jgi:hypothetical protein
VGSWSKQTDVIEGWYALAVAILYPRPIQIQTALELYENGWARAIQPTTAQAIERKRAIESERNREYWRRYHRDVAMARRRARYKGANS